MMMMIMICTLLLFPEDQPFDIHLEFFGKAGKLYRQSILCTPPVSPGASVVKSARRGRELPHKSAAVYEAETDQAEDQHSLNCRDLDSY